MAEIATDTATSETLDDDGSGHNAELLALQRIDEASTQLQQQGNYLGALECMERGLVLRQHFFGADRCVAMFVSCMVSNLLYILFVE